MADFLLNRGADINIKNVDGKTPLQIGEETGQEVMLDILRN